MASELFALHRALAEVGHRRTLPTFDERLIETIRSLDSPSFAPELVGSDRAVLRSTLSDVVTRLVEGPRISEVIHGSPHRFNILVVQGAPRFIDFETVERGPIEWDLAHLDQEVAARYQGSVDLKTLALCRVAISAATSAWCWDAPERGDDMRFHAEHHLAVVRAANT
jgi:thiamine kinase-like enzyme